MKEQVQAKWNVITDEEFKSRAIAVFENVSSALSKSLGPYGATTIIENLGEHHFTKDGWAILKRIVYNMPFEANILQLLTNISGQVVSKSGDGSTSAIVSAYNIFTALQSSDEFKAMRPRDIIENLDKVTKKIVAEISNRSTKVTDYSQIFELAKISLNGDEELAKMIQEIYEQTENPSIEYDGKGTEPQSSYEIIDGFQAPIRYLDPMYATMDDGSAHVKFPLFLLFEMSIDLDNHWPLISMAEAIAVQHGQQLVVVAPNYDKILLDAIKGKQNQELRTNGTLSTIFARTTLVSRRDYKLYNDFAIMFGAKVINHYQLDEILEPTIKAVNDEDYETAPGFIHDYTRKRLWECVGQCTKAIITPKRTFISGFDNRDETIYNSTMNLAKAELHEAEETMRSMNLVNSDFYEAKKRVSRLTGKMGRIIVGGTSTLARNATADLVDDAVKSCESAYRNGYNLGGNLIIPIVIDDILHEGGLSSEEENIYKLLRGAFHSVYKTVIYNKYKGDTVVAEKLLQDSLLNESCYDLVAEEFNDKIINSCETDIEVLKAAVSIVGLITSSNQYLSVSPSIEISHG